MIFFLVYILSLERIQVISTSIIIYQDYYEFLFPNP